MIYTKVKMNIDWEMNIPMPDATSVDEANAEMIKDGGSDAFVKSMGIEVVKGLSSAFTTAKVTGGTAEIVEI